MPHTGTLTPNRSTGCVSMLVIVLRSNEGAGTPAGAGAAPPAGAGEAEDEGAAGALEDDDPAGDAATEKVSTGAGVVPTVHISLHDPTVVGSKLPFKIRLPFASVS